MSIQDQLALSVQRLEAARKNDYASYMMNETNDCAVHAIATIAGIPYVKAHSACAWIRRNGKGMNTSTIALVLENLGMKKEEALVYRQLGGLALISGFGSATMTVNRLAQCEKMQCGQWMIYTRGHCFAMLDGQILDWSRGSKKIVLSAVRYTR